MQPSPDILDGPDLQKWLAEKRKADFQSPVGVVSSREQLISRLEEICSIFDFEVGGSVSKLPHGLGYAYSFSLGEATSINLPMWAASWHSHQVFPAGFVLNRFKDGVNIEKPSYVDLNVWIDSDRNFELIIGIAYNILLSASAAYDKLPIANFIGRVEEKVRESRGKVPKDCSWQAIGYAFQVAGPEFLVEGNYESDWQAYCNLFGLDLEVSPVTRFNYKYSGRVNELVSASITRPGCVLADPSRTAGFYALLADQSIVDYVVRKIESLIEK